MFLNSKRRIRKEIKKCTDMLSYALSPNVGKLANPQLSSALKNHWKKPHKKLKEKNFPSALTCFLRKYRTDKIKMIKCPNFHVIFTKTKKYKLSTPCSYLASLAPSGVWKLLIRWAVAVPLGYVNLKSMTIIWNQLGYEICRSRMERQTNNLFQTFVQYSYYRSRKISLRCVSTFRKGTTEKRPRKLTTKRKPIIHPKAGSLISLALEWSADSWAMRPLIPNS